MTKAIRVDVEIRFVGKAAGIKEGGVLNIARREIEVECLPTNIPEGISLDVSPLGVDETFHVSDLVVPDGVKVLTPGSETLCSVAVVEEEKEAPVVAATAEGAEGAPAAAGAAAPATAEASDDKKDKKE